MTWIFGDLHGIVNTFSALLDKIKSVDSNPELVFVGDYVDRGMYSKQLLDFLLKIKLDYKCTFLRGNHDDVVSYLLNGECVIDIKNMIDNSDKESVFLWWLQNGLYNCIKSYEVDVSNLGIHSLEEFINKVPDSHKQFLKDLDLYWENETHFACHANYPTNVKLPKSFTNYVPQELKYISLWGRFKKNPNGGIQLPAPCEWDKIGVFGHTPTTYYNSPVPVFQDKIRLIDAGGCFGGYLAAYNCEKDDCLLQVTETQDMQQ